jgi:hypothetical protein
MLCGDDPWPPFIAPVPDSSGLEFPAPNRAWAIRAVWAFRPAFGVLCSVLGLITVPATVHGALARAQAAVAQNADVMLDPSANGKIALLLTVSQFLLGAMIVWYLIGLCRILPAPIRGYRLTERGLRILRRRRTSEVEIPWANVTGAEVLPGSIFRSAGSALLPSLRPLHPGVGADRATSVGQMILAASWEHEYLLLRRGNRPPVLVGNVPGLATALQQGGVPVTAHADAAAWRRRYVLRVAMQLTLLVLLFGTLGPALRS